MTTLLLDAGNSRLKWALCEAGQLSQQGSLSYEWPTFAAQLDAALGKLFTGVAAPITGVVMSNVSGERVVAALQEYLQACQDRNAASADSRGPAPKAMVVKNILAQEQAYGVRNAYEQPAQLGADRWAALVAARHHCKGSCCIIDCGTALTVDVLTADGRHAGGIIIPGMDVMWASLLENTHGVDACVREVVSPLAVRNTADAVQAGVQAAMLGAVQQVLQFCRDELGEEPACVLTGGNAQRLLSGLPETTTHEPDWVLKGLAIIASSDE